MIYPENFEEKIGFEKIREILKNNCQFELGVAYVDKVRFSSSVDMISRMIDQTEEFRQIITEGETLPAGNYFNLIPELTRIQVEGTIIELDQLFDLKSSLQTIDKFLKYFISKQETYPELFKVSEYINFDRQIIADIEKIVNDKGEVKDTASSELRDIRRKLRNKLNGIDKKIASSLDHVKKSGWVASDVEPTLRNGRVVIPVLASNKRNIKGFIHDESSTGQTVYIEPEEVFNDNNEIKELENAEKREIQQILKAFTKVLRLENESLIAAYRYLGLIDFIKAKARLALVTNSHKPELIESSELQLKDAKHPLLYLALKEQNKDVVPLNIELNKEKRILIISGPNAGGKSVCLKTIGLNQYMLQCGLLIPADTDSKTGIFENLFLDIGDEQSIEDDLSTYSSHLINIKTFIKKGNSRSLFLIDEFGTGTEPQLGGAIAEASLEALSHKRALGVITTHYANLKLMAGEVDGIMNGAMLYDSRKMMPLYELKIGQPGSSFAFEIAQKIGFPKDILENAIQKSGVTQLDFDKQLQQLEIEKKELTQQKTEITAADDMLANLIEKYQALVSEIEENRKKIYESAREDALRILDSSNRLIENTVQEIREAQAEKERTKLLRKQLEEKKKAILKKPEGKDISQELKKLGKWKSELPPKKETTVTIKGPEDFQVGDLVKITENNVIGEIVAIESNEAIVNFNNVRIRTRLKKLSEPGRDEIGDFKARQVSKKNKLYSDINDKLANFNLVIDVRGKRADEAMIAIKKYVDEAILLSIREVSIIHGKGDGILRNIIRDYLSTIDEVKDYQDQHIERGGHGITVVRFK